MNGRRPLVIAHRGASACRPENTLEAFELAVEQGADLIETDLHLTRDGAVVLLHDPELPGPSGPLPVSRLRLEEIRALPVGARVPELGEVLDLLGRRIGFNLELKRAADGPHAGLAERALALVRSRGLLEQTLFSSFYDPDLAELRRLEPAGRIGLLLSERFPHRGVARARALQAETLHPAREIATRELLREAAGAGLPCLVFTVDEEAEMRRLLELGAAGLFTNHPARLRTLVDREPLGPGPASP